jgi:hypothetical protein
MSKSAASIDSGSLSEESSSRFMWLSIISGTVVTSVLARPSLSMVKVKEVRCLEAGRSDNECQEVRERRFSGEDRPPFESLLVTPSTTDIDSANET